MIALTACGEDTIIEVGLKGTLLGYINPRVANATIIVEGTVPQITVTSDAEGKFVIENLPTGTYNLIFKKAGYGTHKLIGYGFVGGSMPENLSVPMSKLPNIKIKDLTVTTSTVGQSRRIEGTAALDLSQTQSQPFTYEFRYFMGKSSGVSATNYEQTGIVTPTIYYYQNPTKFYIDINTKKFLPGTDIFFVIHPTSGSNISYIDVETGNLIYSAIDLVGSQVKSVKVPM